LLKSIFFGLFVFTIGYRSGPEFFASLSLQTLAQVALALVMGASGLLVILAFAFTLHLDPGTTAGIGAGSLTQTSMMGTASGALGQLGLSDELLKQGQANIAATRSRTSAATSWSCSLYHLVALRLMGSTPKTTGQKLEIRVVRRCASQAGQSPLQKISSSSVSGFDSLRS
jgi:hypothetical protein